MADDIKLSLMYETKVRRHCSFEFVESQITSLGWGHDTSTITGFTTYVAR